MSGELWHAQIDITEDIVKTCLKNQFPSITIQSIECLGEGWDNKVYLINHDIIFRFPRRDIAVGLIERENTLLVNLQNRFKIAIPNPIYVGKAEPIYPFPFQGYPILSGIPGYQAALTLEERIASLKPLTAFLKELHQIDASQALQLGARSPVYDRTQTSMVIHALNERVTKIIQRHFCAIDEEVFHKEMQNAAQIPLPPAKCLVHGDLYCKHILFEQGALSGIIDWGDAAINNRAVDLAVIWSFYPQSCHAQFFDDYGVVDEPTWQFARFLAIHSAITLILYGSDTGDHQVVRESIEALKRINPKLINKE